MVNHLIIENSKLVQNSYKIRHNYVGRMNHRELCKRLKFYHTAKWSMNKAEDILENKTHKILCDFNIKAHDLMFSRMPGLGLINK